VLKINTLRRVAMQYRNNFSLSQEHSDRSPIQCLRGAPRRRRRDIQVSNDGRDRPQKAMKTKASGAIVSTARHGLLK